MFAYCNNNPVLYADPTGYCIQAWAAGYQGPCPGIGKPGCMDYDTSSESDVFVFAPILNNDPVDPKQPPNHPEYKPPKNGTEKKLKIQTEAEKDGQLRMVGFGYLITKWMEGLVG